MVDRALYEGSVLNFRRNADRWRIVEIFRN